MSTLHKEAQEKQLRLRIRIENTAITLLAVFSLFLFILTFSLFPEYRRPCRSLLKWAEWFSVHSQLSFLSFPYSYGKGNETHGLLPCLFSF